MIDAALNRVPVKLRTDTLIWLLVAAAFASGFATNTFRRAITVNRTVTVPARVNSGVEAAAALGKPDSVVDGAQVNPQLKGLTCGVWQAKRAVLCYPAP